MSLLLLAASVAGFAGSTLGAYLAVLHFTGQEVHMPAPVHVTERRGRRGGLVLVAGFLVMLLVLAGQAYVAQRDAAARDREFTERADCLDTFAVSLVDTLTARVMAQQEKDEALDAVVLAVAAQRAKPPRGTAQDFDRALTAFVLATQRLARIQADNRYAPPRVVCR